MSPTKELSPEEKLLKVIQQGRSTDETPGRGNAPPVAKLEGGSAHSAAPAKPKPEAKEQKTAPTAAATPAPAPTPAAAPAAAAKPEGKGSKPEAPKLKLADEIKVAPAPAPVAEPTTAPALAPMPDMGAVARQPFTIRVVNRYLLVAALVLLGVVVVDFVTASSSATLALKEVPGSTGEKSTVRAGSTIATLGPLESYQLRLAKRNIFLPFAPPPPPPPPGSTVTNLPPPPPMMTDLKLLMTNVDTNDAESMASFTDSSGKPKYLVKTGQAIGESGIILQKVLSDHVQLKTSKGGEIILR